MRGSLLSEEVQLGYALEAFQYAHDLRQGWSTQKLLYLSHAGINSMNDLSTGCKDNTVNLDLDLFGIPKEERISSENIERLKFFLPGPVGYRAFRLAQKCANKVKRNEADTNYVHRPEDGKIGKERWSVPVDDDWTLNVDCAGFVRNVLKHVTKDPFRMSLSDRDFMRAKDFYRFFETIPYSVTDQEKIGKVDDVRMKWRLVRDLRMVIPGDVIVYRPRGNAAGGAAFTENDREDIKHCLRAIKTAQLWHQEENSLQDAVAVSSESASSSSDDYQLVQRQLVTRNIAKDPAVKPWVRSTEKILNSIGIDTIRKLKSKLDVVNALLKENGHELQFSDEELKLMEECCKTTAMNTGHILFASGPAVKKADDEYRIRVIHSTKYGQDGNQGIEEYYKRFQLVVSADGKSSTWTREMRRVKPKSTEDSATVDTVNESDDDEDNPNDDMEEEPDDDEEENDDNNNSNKQAAVDEDEDATGGGGDELAGTAEVEVLAARMCF